MSPDDDTPVDRTGDENEALSVDRGTAPAEARIGATAQADPEAACTLVARIEAMADRYPNRKSAIIPALHLAQETYGWLPPEAFEAVAEALETTPAFAQSIATFYDMFRLEPMGTHLIEVCTNVACGLRGAGEIVDELEDQLGIHAGETTQDGRISLRTVECLGGCGTAPTVAVNHRFREFFTTGQVKPLVTELNATAAADGWAAAEGEV